MRRTSCEGASDLSGFYEASRLKSADEQFGQKSKYLEFDVETTVLLRCQVPKLRQLSHPIESVRFYDSLQTRSPREGADITFEVCRSKDTVQLFVTRGSAKVGLTRYGRVTCDNFVTPLGANRLSICLQRHSLYTSNTSLYDH